MNCMGRQWAGLKRFWHRKGYGVHSPFAFNFLTSVVYERGAYYAYRELERRHPVAAFHGHRHAVKCRQFLFRLANYVHPDIIRVIGHVGVAEVDYMSAGCRSAVLLRNGAGEVRALSADGSVPPTELVWIGADVPFSDWNSLVSRPVARHTVCVFSGIYESEAAERAWEDVKRQEAVVVTFDLYDYGLVFFDRSKQRQHYVIKF